MQAQDIMLSLIRSEICGIAINEQIKDELTADKYKQLYIISKKHDLSHIVASALSRMNFLKDDEVSVAFQKQLMTSLYRDSQREYAINLTCELLEKAHIPHILLKGTVLRHLYPQTWMRTSCDIDILIKKTDADMVQKVLCDAGFSRFEDKSTHDYNYVAPNNVIVEMHYTLTQDGKITSCDALLESVWDLYSSLDDGYNYRYSLTSELFVIYHLTHMGRHLLHGGCGIRPFLDLWLINRQQKIDFTKLNELLSQCNLSKLYDISTELGKVWLEGYKHSDNTRVLSKYVLNGGVYGTTKNAAKVKAASGIGKIHSFINIMFLSKDRLKVLYPELEKYPKLYPFFQAKRWFGIFNKNKRNRIKNLTEKRNAVTKHDVNSTVELLELLGLE